MCMLKSDVAKTLEIYDQYLKERQEVLKNDIDKLQQQIESEASQIEEKEIAIELQTKKLRQEENIFNLYNTTKEYEQAIQLLKKELEQLQKDKATQEKHLELSREESDRVAKLLKKNEQLVKEVEEQLPDETKDETTKQKMENEPEKGHNVELPRTTKQDIRERLEFCLNLLDLDQQRCSLELQMLIQDLQ